MDRLVAKIMLIKANMSLTRKVFRFGGEIPSLLSIINRLKQHSVKPVKMLFFQTLNDILNILYVLTDHPLYLVKVGFIKNWAPAKVKALSWWSDFIWFV